MNHRCERLLVVVINLCLAAAVASAQTTVDLKTQSKRVDFTGASSTFPFKAGTAVPTTCQAGEAFFDLSAPAGDNLYLCTATNTWSLITSGTSNGVSGPDTSTANGVAMFGDDTGGVLAEAAGCQYTLVDGKGILSCTGGIESGDGTYQGGFTTRETTTNGGMYEFGVFGPGDQSADRCIVLPDQQPLSGQVLRATSNVVDVVGSDKTWMDCQVMAWEYDASSGTYYAPFGLDGGSTQTLGASNRVELGGFVLPFSVDLTRAVVGVDSTSTGGLIGGIYDTSCDLVAQSAAVDVTGSRKYSLLFSPAVPLSAGTLYYFGWSSDNASMKIETPDDEADSLSFLRAIGLAIRAGNLSTGASTSLSLPATCGVQDFGGTAPALVLSEQ